MLKHIVATLGILACGTLNAQAAERFEITAGIFGGTQYQYCFALSEIFKQQAPQFELLPVETTGSPASLIKASQKPAKTVFATSTTSFVDAVQGNSQEERQAHRFRHAERADAHHLRGRYQER